MSAKRASSGTDSPTKKRARAKPTGWRGRGGRAPLDQKDTESSKPDDGKPDDGKPDDGKPDPLDADPATVAAAFMDDYS